MSCNAYSVKAKGTLINVQTTVNDLAMIEFLCSFISEVVTLSLEEVTFQELKQY